MHENIFKYKKYRYLKFFVFLTVSSIVLYFTTDQSQPANGGTLQGYILGGVATFFILLLTYLGVRKRRYAKGSGTVQGWTSAHIYIGASLVLITSLHAGFQVGLNIHTLAYVLMLIVILSGFYGMFTYIHYPRVFATNNSGGSQDQWLDELSDIDDVVNNLASSCRAEIRLFVLSAIEKTVITGGFFSMLRAKDFSKIQMQTNKKKIVSNKDQSNIIDFLANAVPNSMNHTEASAISEMLSLFSRRQRLLKIVRRNLQIKAFYKLWLLFHIPLTFALLAALIVHILVVFIYW